MWKACDPCYHRVTTRWKRLCVRFPPRKCTAPPHRLEPRAPVSAVTPRCGTLPPTTSTQIYRTRAACSGEAAADGLLVMMNGKRSSCHLEIRAFWSKMKPIEIEF